MYADVLCRRLTEQAARRAYSSKEWPDTTRASEHLDPDQQYRVFEAAQILCLSLSLIDSSGRPYAFV